MGTAGRVDGALSLAGAEGGGGEDGKAVDGGWGGVRLVGRGRAYGARRKTYRAGQAPSRRYARSVAESLAT